ncbi:PIN domain-containing protein [Thermodesulfatator atlanticus]|uniref:PIN domain-containing protein n=1 Tax=Thermodesulfatator atlanticus TaxID=501497 RepID=UPI0003B6BD15|nr:PIN domain-containing protein [Thermodesulfatator atlanticus]
MRVVIDTNLIFSLLLRKNKKLLGILFSDEVALYAPPHLFLELFKHKDRLLKFTNLKENELLELLLAIFERIEVISYRRIPKDYRAKWFKKLEKCDPADFPFVLTAIVVEGKLWTGDFKLKNCLEENGIDVAITTEELIENLKCYDELENVRRENF